MKHIAKAISAVLFASLSLAAQADVTINNASVASLDFTNDNKIILKINEQIPTANSCTGDTFSADLTTPFGKAAWTSLMAALTNGLTIARLDYARTSTTNSGGQTVWNCAFTLVEVKN